MRHGDNRLHAVFLDLVNQTIVKLQPLFIRCLFIAVREDPGPGNTGAERAEAHFLHQCQIFFIGMVKINAVAFRKIAFFILHRCLNSRQRSSAFFFDVRPIQVLVKGMDIGCGQPSAIHIIRALYLAGRHSAAPHKILRKSGRYFFHYFSSCFLNPTPFPWTESLSDTNKRNPCADGRIPSDRRLYGPHR